MKHWGGLQGTSKQSDDKHIPLIILDECHRAKHLLPEEGEASLTATAVHLLQERVPNAAVLYSSATGISEPRNMVREHIRVFVLFKRSLLVSYP
jgi:P-loop containing NTP hydrolase pore-1